VSQAGGAEELKFVDAPVPKCGPRQVLINIKVAGINYIDINIRTGLYPQNYPYTPGKEGSGVVSEVGEQVSDFKPGDRVAFCVWGSGSYAEYTVVDEERVVKIPDNLSFEFAAASMLQGLTAYYLSHETYRINQSSQVLIHAGAGGVGLLLIQLAKYLKAKKIITTVSNKEKANLTKVAGADEIILYTEEDFLTKTLELTSGRGVDVVYDGIGKTTFLDSLKALAIRGMLVFYGQASGPIQNVPLKDLAEKSLYLTRPNLANYISLKSELTRMSHALFNYIAEGTVEITIGQIYPLEQASKAQADLETRKTIGKSVLLI
jgi:NADPH2:quinone reductase